MYELKLLADIRGINVKKTLKTDETFEILCKYGQKR